MVLEEHRIVGGAGEIAIHTAQGVGPAIVLVHGNSSDSSVWRSVVEHFRGLRIVAIDLRGHGRSDWARPPAYATADYADDISAVIHALDLRDFILVGHSNGALAALAYAAFREPKPRRLVYIDIAPSVPEYQVTYFRQRASAVARPYASLDKLVAGMAIVDPTVPVATFTDYVAGLVTPIEAGMKLSFDPETYGSWQPANLWDALAGLACPLTVMRGSESQVLNEADAVRMRHIRSDARFVVVNGAGHFLMLTVPEQVAAIALDGTG